MWYIVGSGGVMVSVLASSVVYRGFISGVMVSVLAASVVYRGFISGVMVSVLASSVVYRGFEPRSGQTKYYKIGMRCFFAKHAALRRKSKNCMAWNQDHVSECGDTSISGLLFQ
jgi:hypothetical protein